MTSETDSGASGAADEQAQTMELLDIDRAECLRLVASLSFGRLVVSTPDGTPMIRPVNYIYDEPSQSIIFRTALGSKFHALLMSKTAVFEIDAVDESAKTGWSVIVSGMTEEITAPNELQRLKERGLT